MACGVDVRTQLAEPRVCAASQYGGAMFVYGNDDSALTMTISDVTITGCSAEAGGDGGVRARHAAQWGPSVGGAGVTGAGVPRVACGVDVRTRLASRCDGAPCGQTMNEGLVDMNEVQMNERERG